MCTDIQDSYLLTIVQELESKIGERDNMLIAAQTQLKLYAAFDGVCVPQSHIDFMRELDEMINRI